MVLFYVSLILFVLYYLIYYYFRRTFDYWKKKNVSGPTPLTFYGNLKDSILRRKNIGEVFQDLYNMYPNEKVIGIYRTTVPALLIRDLDIIKHIMIKDFDKFVDRGVEFSQTGLGVNLFHADGDAWTALRSRFTPIFTSGKLKNMFYLLNETAQNFVKFMDKETRISPEQDVYSVIQRYTIASISACAFGVNFDTFGENLEAYNRLQEINKLMLTPTFLGEIDMMFPGILRKISVSFFPKAVIKFFNDLVKNVVKQRNGKPTSRHDFMDLILELREIGKIQSSKGKLNKLLDITDDVIAAQAFVFYLGGFETSATTMAYLLHHLAMQSDIQEKLIAEIDESLRNNDNQISYYTLKDMKYLEKVFNETLRMHSIIEPLQRKAKEDYKLPGTDIVVEKGQLVFISPRGIHYDAKYYPNPEVFDPERFAMEETGNRHPCAYLPFGTGPRNCIGMRFGHIQSRLCIAHLLSKYRVEPSQNSVKNLEIEAHRGVIGPKNGISLNIVPRN